MGTRRTRRIEAYEEEEVCKEDQAYKEEEVYEE